MYNLGLNAFNGLAFKRNLKINNLNPNKKIAKPKPAIQEQNKFLPTPKMMTSLNAASSQSAVPAPIAVVSAKNIGRVIFDFNV